MARTGIIAGVAAVGGLMVWSGVSNAGVLTSIRDIIQGSAPTPGPVQVTANSGGSVENGDTGQGIDGVGGSLVSVSGSGAQAGIVAYALAQVGKPYKVGGVGPDDYDCSGLIWAAYKSQGFSIPRTTFVQIVNGTRVPIADAQPGDLLFPEPGHVFMNIGPGQCVEARHTGTTIWTRSYSNSELIAVRRYL